MSQAGHKELHHGVMRLKIFCPRLRNKQQLLLGCLIHRLAEDLTGAVIS